MSNNLTSGVNHVGLTVPDVNTTADFFCDILGFKRVGQVADYPAIFVSDGMVMLTLWQVNEPETAVAFNRKTNIGLHHLALTVKDEAALSTLHQRLSEHSDVAIEFALEPIMEGSSTLHFICAIPGGIRVESATPFA